MWDVQAALTMEELWKVAVGYLSVELSADRAVVMFDEDGNQEFAIVGHRRVDPHQLWNGSQVDLGLLKLVCRERSVQVAIQGDHAVVCCPVNSADGRKVLGLLYADRPVSEEEFSGDEAEALAVFASHLTARIGEFSPRENGEATSLAAEGVPAQHPPDPVAAEPAAAGAPPAAAAAPPTAVSPPPTAAPAQADPGASSSPAAAVPSPSPVASATPSLPTVAPPAHATAAAEPPQAAMTAAPAAATPPAAAGEPLASPVTPVATAPAEVGSEKAPAAVAKPTAPPAADPAADAAKTSSAPIAVVPPPPTPAPGRRASGHSILRNDLVGGRFILGEPLLVCRFSTLYEALDRATGTSFVLRKLEGQEAESREARSQTLREGRFLARLVHRNLPRVLEVVEDKGHVYLVLEEFSGTTLEGNTEALAHELLERYLEQFLSVLEYLHGQDPPIVHRDLRPDTILVTTHGVLKLAEFGLARMRESRTDPRQTAFRALGSPHFAPPEQLLGEPSSAHNDLYAVGSILYFLATAQVPVKSVDRWYGAVVLPSLRELRPDLDRRLVQLVERLMESEIEKRFKTVAEVAEALEELRSTPEPEPEPEVELTMSEAPVEQTFSERIDKVLTAPLKSGTRDALQPKRSAFGVLADKFGAWNLLLGRKKKESASLALHEDDSVIVEFHSDLNSGGEIDLAQSLLDLKLGRILPETVAKSIQGIVLAQPSENELTVAVKDPTEVHIYDHISLATQGKYKATLVRADAALIDLAIEYIYRSNQFSEAIPWNEWLDRKSFETEELQVANPMAELSYGVDEITSPIIAAVDKMIKEAISVGASDIHMESYELGMDLRYRIDGQLHQINHYTVHEASAMVKRLKVMANMDIAQERMTQGGRISLKVGGQELDLRVSIVPVPAGESVVMRLLKKGAFHLTLKDLGFADHTLESFDHILAQPYGMILVCGPTGSGKSTSLYASLKQIQRPDRKLLTVEDPIEYQMPGICQVQVNITPKEDDKKVTFARVLREFLRQDPDVILVGEIRDTETASIAVQAALTGHLLLSTIHTNDSVGIIARLTDMQVEPFLIGSTLLGGLAQRLARRICQHCREEVSVTDDLKRIFEKEGINTPPRMFHGVGCKKCHHTGARGRLGLYELLVITPEVRALINRRAMEEEVRQMTLDQGFKTLYYDGLSKVAQGMVSLEEVQRVCKTI